VVGRQFNILWSTVARATGMRAIQAGSRYSFSGPSPGRAANTSRKSACSVVQEGTLHVCMH
jgi:hypothetical protein